MSKLFANVNNISPSESQLRTFYGKFESPIKLLQNLWAIEPTKVNSISSLVSPCNFGLARIPKPKEVSKVHTAQ